MAVAERVPESPQHGDVLIRKVPPRTYRIGLFEQEPQVTFDTFNKAVKQALADAATAHVDVWRAGPDGSFLRIAQHRLHTAPA